MSTGSDSSVIRKKALNGREDFDTRAMSWSKAARLSLERVSDRLFNLQLSVRTVEQVSSTLAELRDAASGDRLIMLLDAYGDLSADEAQNGMSGRAAVILDRALVQTLVEVQTRGRITEAELETRAFTHTDAAVTAQLIDPVLASVDDMMSDSPHSPDPLRLRYGDKVEDVRALLLALEAPDYALFRISIDIEAGTRSADVMLAIPDDMLRPPQPTQDPDDAEAGAFDLSGMALSAPIPLNAVVARLNMPLSRVCALKAGDTLTVERNGLMETELVGSKGFVVGKVALGQMNGFRAVRLGPDAPDDDAPARDKEETVALTPSVSATDAPALSKPAPLDAEPLQVPELPALDPLPDAEVPNATDLPETIDPLDIADLADLSGLDDATLGDLAVDAGLQGDDPTGLAEEDLPDLSTL